MKIKAVIFDFDFTLGDSSKGIVLCVNHALGQLGYPEKDGTEIKKTIGLSLKDTFLALVPDGDSDEALWFAELFKEKADEVMVENTVLYEGTEDVLRKLKENGFKTGIVTTKFHYRIEQILNKFEAGSLIDVIIGVEDVKAEKPAPDGLLMAAGRMGAEKEETLYVGDSFVDAQAAERAGIPFAGVLTGTTSREVFEKYPHICIGGSLMDIAIRQNLCYYDRRL